MTHDLVKLRKLAVAASKDKPKWRDLMDEFRRATMPADVIAILDALHAANARVKELEATIKAMADHLNG